MFYQTKLQIEQKGKSFGLNNLLFFVINISLTILFLVAFDMKAEGVIAAMAATNALFFFVSLAKYVPTIKLGIDKEILKESFRYALPIIPYNLASISASLLDRLFLNGMRSTAETGLYSVGAQFANVISVVAVAIGQAFSPWFYSRVRDGEKRQIVMVTKSIVYIYSLLAYLISWGMPIFMDLLMNRVYSDSSSVAPFLCSGAAVYGIYILLCNNLFLEKTRYLPLITFFGSSISVALNVILIPSMGILGASISNLSYNWFVTLFLVFVAERVEPIGHEKLKLFAPMLLSLLCSVAHSWLLAIDRMLAALSGIAILIALAGGLFLIDKQAFIEGGAFLRNAIGARMPLQKGRG
jgi:O-antigen/teichoic acid export membrane protein